MKTTPFFELSVALRGRSTFFRSIVILAFAFSITISLLGAIQVFNSQSKMNLQVRHNPSKIVDAGVVARAAVR